MKCNNTIEPHISNMNKLKRQTSAEMFEHTINIYDPQLKIFRTSQKFQNIKTIFIIYFS